MAIILGIDLGTSSAKAMLLDTERGVIDIAAEEYDVSIPSPGRAEQDPDTWWASVAHILQRMKEKNEREFSRIASVGFSGQMHGLVTLGRDGKPLRPAIIWLDQRAHRELEEIQSAFSQKEIAEVLHNRIYSGFAFPSLLWIKNNEPDIFAQIHSVMQPKDYIRYKLTGEIGCEVTDASSSLLFDIHNRGWAEEFIQKLGIPQNIFPKCAESTDIAGYITGEAAAVTGLPAGIPAVYGSGDQPAQSLGNGAISEGTIICNIGTGGQISTYSANDRYDPHLRTHTFCHCINKGHTIFGAILSGGMSLKWLKNNVLHEKSFEELSRQAGEIEPGRDNPIFLPYLSGERTPYMNPDAKSVLFGLQLHHDSRHISRAVMEGVTFALKDSLSIIEAMGIKSKRVIASGGAAASPVWLQIQADIFDKEITVSRAKEQACMGACILAALGIGLFESAEQACRKLLVYDEIIYTPIPENVSVYNELYMVFKGLYKNTEEFM